MSKFSTTLTITTNAFNGTDNPTVITVPLNMYAQGVIIDPLSTTTWNYPQITWPAATYSTFTTLITNRGNVAARVTLSVGGSSPFQMNPPSNFIDIPASTVLSVPSIFGTFNKCAQTSTTYSAPGQVTITADGSSVGACGTVSGQWVQSITLTGQVNRTGLMCTTGQRCLPSTDVTKNDCICDQDFSSCGLTGCCTALDNGICVVYANQTALVCGAGGAQCNGCGTGQTCSTTTGQCSCNCPGGCCDSNGTCQAGTEPSLCGTQSATCSNCSAMNKSCISQTCQ